MIIEGIKAFVSFANGNLVGIIILAILPYLILYLSYHFILNIITTRQYSRENGDNDEKFETMRCLEDGAKGERNNIYLINKKSEPKTYQLIDVYTYKQLGYRKPSREDEECFSKKDHKLKKRIKIYNVIFDLGYLIKLLKDIKN